MTKLLLTGAGGQLGRELSNYAPLLTHYTLVACDRAALDISDFAQLQHAILTIQPDVIINAAGYTKVDLAEQEAAAAQVANARGAANLAEVCAAQQIPLIHLSTDYIFNGEKSSAYVEEDLAAPLNSYGRSKWEGEQAIRALLPQHIILRVSWVYGLYGANFVKTMLRLGKERTELKIVADQLGCPTATLDIAALITQILPKIIDSEAYWGTYHFCSGEMAVSWYEFAQQILANAAEITELKVQQILPITSADFPMAAQRPQNSWLNCRKIRDTFGIQIPDWRTTLPYFIREAYAEQ